MLLSELLNTHTKDELYSFARGQLFMNGISKLNKKELIAAINAELLTEESIKKRMLCLDNKSLKVFLSKIISPLNF